MTHSETVALRLEPPQAQRRPQRKIVHDHVLIDDYAWMRADNWQQVLADPTTTPKEIREHLDAENTYARAVLAPTEGLQKTLVSELRGRIKEDDASVPAPDGSYAYYTRYRQDGQYVLVCRCPRDGGTETLLLDGDALATDASFFDIRAAIQSDDHRLLAWSSDDKGSELYVIRVRDIASGQDLSDRVTRCDGSIVWAKDATAFYYVRVDDNHRTAQVFRHQLGTPEEQDRLIIEELDARWFVHLHRSQSGHYAVVSMRDHDASECWLIDLEVPEKLPELVSAREKNLRYDVEHWGDQLIIRTNADGAEDFKIMSTPLTACSRENWVDVVAHQPGRLIINLHVFTRYQVRLERESGLHRIIIRDEGGNEHAIAFSEEAYVLKILSGYEFDTDMLRFVYASMTTPGEVYDYDMKSRTRVLRKRQEIPSGHNPADYVTRRIFATAPDGALVPISLLARADRPMSDLASAPCLLYGYGAYGHAIDAGFNANRFSLVDRGFVYAIAHIRGGTDKGWAWYENGKLQHKPNTFSDFIAAGRKLIADGWTREGQIVAQGGSAGGMLMGAVVNMAPDLFAGIIADVPFVDVINTMLDDTLPLTPPEWREWGNPVADAKAFATMLSYSPYDNIKPQNYPPVMALGGLTDPRVTYWEPAKWVARLRATMTGGGPVILTTNMDAGHGGASGRFDQLDEVAQEQAFAIGVVGGMLASGSENR